MKLIYIASPYAGDIENNIEFARQACRYCIDQGYAPVAPHLLYPQILDDSIPEERRKGLSLGLRLLEGCDELWLCGEELTDGMMLEHEYAFANGIPVELIGVPQIIENRDMEGSHCISTLTI